MRILNGYGYEDMLRDIDNISPQCTHVFSCGKSALGSDLPVLVIGSGTEKLLFTAGQHGREFLSSKYLMEAAKELLKRYDLLNIVSAYFAPMTNPDGVEIALNSSPTYKANANGVDLNRNYPCCWNELSATAAKPGPEFFKGFSPASEPEVQAIMKLCYSHHFLISAAFHLKGEEIYFADQNTPDVYNKSLSIALKLSSASGYALLPPSPIDKLAGFENWFRQEFNRPSVLIELAPYNSSPMPYDTSVFENLIWKKAKSLCEIFSEFATIKD